MTKADIAEKIQAVTGFKKNESLALLESVLAMMKETLISGEALKISGFGKFEVKKKQDRKGRNPQTGEALTISARNILTFKPSTLLRNNVNGR